MRFSRQEYWSGLPFPPPRELLNSRIKPMSPAFQVDSLPLSHQGNPNFSNTVEQKNLVRMSDQLSQSFKTPHRGPTLVSPHPERSKAETYRKSWEQRRKMGATNLNSAGGVPTVPSDTAHNPSSLCH